MAKKLNTINKMTYAKMATLQAPLATKTKQREDKCCARATEEATYLKQNNHGQPWGISMFKKIAPEFE